MTHRQANTLIALLTAAVLLLAAQNVMLLRELRHVHKASEAAEELSAEAVDKLTVAQPVAVAQPGCADDPCTRVIHHRDGSTEEHPCDPVEVAQPVEVRVESAPSAER